MEKQQIFGKQVDYLFYTTLDPFVNYIYYVLNKNDNIYCVNKNINFHHQDNLTDLKVFLKGCMVKSDIYINTNNRKYLHLQHNRTVKYIDEVSGLTILRYFLVLGYKSIHLAGFDFYKGKYYYLNKKKC